MKKRAILVVSFGTSYEETRENTIGAIEMRIQNAFPDAKVFRAFTSRIIQKKMREQGIPICNVQEALQQIRREGFTEKLIVQPTHIINGLEYDFMRREVMGFADQFQSVSFGKPLLSDTVDYRELAEIVKEAYPVACHEALVLMGHGSRHHANSAYPAFAYVLKDAGYEHIYIGTVEGYPALDEVKRQLQKRQIKKVCLVPLMIVAGEHANHDMIGEDDSWKVQLEQEGYQVRYCLNGLGALKPIQDLFVRHIKESEPIERNLCI